MATIKDISKVAGVSPGTVSRALSPSKNKFVAEETKQKVKTIADQLGYEYDSSAKKAKNTIEIAVLTTMTLEEETRDEYWRFVRRGMYEAAERENITLGNINRIQDGVDLQEIARASAVIIIGTVTIAAVKKIKQYNKNVIIVDGGGFYHDLADIVDTNLGELTISILNQLAAHTSGKIAFIGCARNQMDLDGQIVASVEDARTKAYKQWTADHHQPEIYKEISPDTGSAMAVTESLLKKYDRDLSAILVWSDPFAIGAMRALAKHQLVAGKDIALMSFDDLEFASFLTPSLSSIWIPKAELGFQAIIHAKSMIKHKRHWTVRNIIPGKIQYRETFNPNS